MRCSSGMGFFVIFSVGRDCIGLEQKKRQTIHTEVLLINLIWNLSRQELHWPETNMPAVHILSYMNIYAYTLHIQLINSNALKKVHLSACNCFDTCMISPVGAPGGPSRGMLGMAGFLSVGACGCCWMGLKGAGTPAGCGGSCCGWRDGCMVAIGCGSPSGAMIGAVIGAGGV